MSEPFLGEIKMISWNFPPKGWAFCNGQLMQINQNQALFSLFGTTYGGDGRVNFGLPNLQGRTPIHVGAGFIQGQVGGESAHTVTNPEMPSHNHLVNANTNAANSGSPTGNFWSATGSYAGSSNAAMASAAITTVGGSQPHANLQPYLVINFIVALQGIFPSPN